MRFAPAEPSIESLEATHPLTPETIDIVANTRLHVAQALVQPGHFIDIAGPCALTGAKDIDEQGTDLKRMCAWKPRSNPDSWHGLETTEPEEAFRLITEQAKRYGNVALEIGRVEHIVRYGARIGLGWFGGRNDDPAMKRHVAVHDPKLPLGVKNPLSGEVNETLDETEALRSLRGSGGAPVVLIYRGGENAKTPGEWEKRYIEAFEKTNGLMIVDTAHGAEMAHDPNGQFQKSAEAQMQAMEHLVELSMNGYAPAAVMSEASNLESPVDPPMPLRTALEGLAQIRQMRLQQYAAQSEAEDRRARALGAYSAVSETPYFG